MCRVIHSYARRFSILVASATCLLLTGCSVFMAATPREAPDLSRVRKGASRADIESVLGKPISFIRKRGGDVATYQFISGDKKNYGRAAAYAVIDVLTLGASEFVTFPIEALQGNRHVVRVIYTPSGKAMGVLEEVHEAPVDTPERLLGIDQVGAESPEAAQAI